MREWRVFYLHPQSGVFFKDLTVHAETAADAYGLAKYRMLPGDGQYEVIGIFRADLPNLPGIISAS